MTMPSTFERTVRGLAHFVLVLVGAAVLSQPMSAQRPEPLDTAGRVIVSRNEVRVYFPPQPKSALSSSVTPRAGGEPASLLWVAELDGATTLRLRFRGSLSPEFTPSLLSIVRAGRANDA